MDQFVRSAIAGSFFGERKCILLNPGSDFDLVRMLGCRARDKCQGHGPRWHRALTGHRRTLTGNFPYHHE